MNTKFSYEYRDGDNYHVHRDVVVAGHLTMADLEPHMDRGVCAYYGFIPSQVGLENLQYELAAFGNGTLDDSRDHVWHSFFGMEPTDEAPTVKFTAAEFIEAFRKVNMKWDMVGVSEKLGIQENP